MSTLRVGLAQLNTTIGDFDGNVRKIADFAARARDAGVDVVSFPELTITGYPPEDLLLRPRFVEDGRRALYAAVVACTGLSAVIGFVDVGDAGIYNAAAIVHDGRLVATSRNQPLPTAVRRTAGWTRKKEQPKRSRARGGTPWPHGVRAAGLVVS